MTTKLKKLNMANLKKLDGIFSETISVKVSDEFDPIHINKSFRLTLITQLISELAETVMKAKEQEIEIDKILPSYISLLILKYFSDLTVPDGLEKQIQYIDLLVDHGFLPILMDAYDEKEVKKLNDYIKKYSDNLPKMIEMINEEASKSGLTINERIEENG